MPTSNATRTSACRPPSISTTGVMSYSRSILIATPITAVCERMATSAKGDRDQACAHWRVGDRCSCVMQAAGGAQMSGEGQSTTRGIEWDAYSST